MAAIVYERHKPEGCKERQNGFLFILSPSIGVNHENDSCLHLHQPPNFGKRKQVIYHLNLSYLCFHILPSVLFFQAKFYTSTLILLRDMLGKTPWYSIDVSGNDRHILLFYKKCHFCHLLPFGKVGQSCLTLRGTYGNCKLLAKYIGQSCLTLRGTYGNCKLSLIIHTAPWWHQPAPLMRLPEGAVGAVYSWCESSGEMLSTLTACILQEH